MDKFILAVAVGGAFGSLARYLLSRYVHEITGHSFPLGTLLVNLTGAFLIGFVFSLCLEKCGSSPAWKALIVSGFLGGLTTFSTFAYESFSLLSQGEILKFFLYLAGTNLLGLLFTFVGFWTGKLL
ncbi:MAG: fluoride efflux transporter CrcB [Aquificae bacterium]|nr:fluoride efflux transporter CrcB [Aquificota bacterium]